MASQEGHVEVVDKLLQHGATVDLVHTLYKKRYTHYMYIRNASKCVCKT